MEIGTPLFEGSKKLLFFGGEEVSKEMVIEAQRMGIETVVVDKYDMAPAMHVSHRKYVVNMLDENAIKSIVKREKPDAIIVETGTINTEALIDLESEGFKVVPNARTIKICTNRIELRNFIAEKLKIPSVSYGIAENPEEVKKICKDIGYPCIIKPEIRSGEYDIEIIYNEEEVENKFKELLANAEWKSSKVIVEEHVKIDKELIALTYRYLTDNGIETKTITPMEHQKLSDIFHYVESWHPTTANKEIIEKSQEYATRIANELGGFGVFSIEILVSDNKVLLSEVFPRPHDTEFATIASLDINAFQIHIRSALGLPTPEVKLVSPAAAHVILANSKRWAPKFLNIDKALQIPGVQIRLFGKPSTYYDRKVGVVIATGNTLEEAKEKARKAASLILVI